MIVALTLLSILLLFCFPADSWGQRIDCDTEKQQVKMYKIPTDLKPIYVVYDKYAYNGSIIDYTVTDTFVIVENERKEQLEPYKPKTVQMPLISVMVIDSDSRVEGTTSSKEDVSEYIVYFGFNKYRVTEKQRKILEKIHLKGGETANIFGYACVIGPKSYNQKLSQKRAEEVAKYLRKKEIPVGTVVGMGEKRQEKELKKNRKVVIKITKQGGKG